MKQINAKEKEFEKIKNELDEERRLFFEKYTDKAIKKNLSINNTTLKAESIAGNISPDIQTINEIDEAGAIVSALETKKNKVLKELFDLCNERFNKMIQYLNPREELEMIQSRKNQYEMCSDPEGKISLLNNIIGQYPCA